jgi:hypothetical protein
MEKSMTISFKSAGVSVRTINLSGPTPIQPSGVPAGVIGTSLAGPAFVPVTVATTQDFAANFGETSNDIFCGPLAVSEWLRNAQSATFIRVLGVGGAAARETTAGNAGKVSGAGFVVGNQIPQYWGGAEGDLLSSSYATAGGPLGRTYFLGAFMSGAAGSTYLTDAGLAATGVPMIRGVLFGASGTLLQLSSSLIANNTYSATVATAGGTVTGSVKLSSGLQEFVLIINGHTNTDTFYPHVITASYDVTAPNYFGRVFNRDPFKLEEAGYYLQSDWSVHPSLAVVTGAGVINTSLTLAGSSSVNALRAAGYENVAFLVTGSQTQNVGSATAPNFENWENRFTSPKSTWITSQAFGGKPINLFRIHSLDDGSYANTKVKLSIQGIKPTTSDAYLYGTFDLLVRDFSDTDIRPIVLEAYTNLTLDPSSDHYIAKVIGDSRTFFNFDALEGSSRLVSDGNYTNNSKYIRVEVSPAVENSDIDPTALPLGFRGAPHLMTAGTAPLKLTDLADGATVSTSGSFLAAVSASLFNTVQLPVPFRENLARGDSSARVSDSSLYWGVQFERKVSVTETNSTTVPETTIASFTSYFPDFSTEYMHMVTYDNEGTPDTLANGIIDADRFNNNAFSLENIQCQCKAIAGTTNLFPYNVTPDVNNLQNWTYVRTGNPVSGSSGISTRGLLITDLVDDSVRSVAKFNFFLQGGFDGVNVFNYDETYMTNKAVNEELILAARGEQTGSAVSAYNTALNLIADSTELDMQLFVIPGIRNPVITDRALQIAENRFDALYIMDLENYDINNVLVTDQTQVISVTNTITNHRDRGINSSFGATYFPDVNMRDDMGASQVIRQVPSSVVALGAFSTNDRIAYPWFAPAGFARGSLSTSTTAAVQLGRDGLDSLYQANINPIVSFQGSNGLIIWGQKTLYAQQSSLDRVNVRRLLLSLRRQVRQVAMRILFEQTLPATLARFSQLVNPILQKVQSQNGLDRYLVQIDATTTTQADFENKTIRGKIFIQPTKVLEYLSVDFVINNPNNFGQG